VKHATCIINSRVTFPGKRIERLLDELRGTGIDLDIAVTQSAPEARAVARRSVDEAVDMVIAIGGDGTVHGILQEVVQSPTSLAIVPMGTGNDIARALGIRGVLEELISEPVRVDVAHIAQSDTWFLSVLATGFDAQVNARANRLGYARYIRAFLREFPSLRPFDYELVIDGQSRAGGAIMVCLGNTSTYGGGMIICPEANIHDGTFAITWISPVGRLRLLRFFPKVFRGQHVRLPEVECLQGTHVEIRGPRRQVFADGEPVGEIPVTTRVVPGALFMHVASELTREAS
jgi:diacylglycerol kinase (ATP)